MSADDFRSTPVAIVGMACRLPGADGLEQFWKLLIEGRHGISVLPADRLDQRLYYDERRLTPEKSYSRIAGTVPIRPTDRAGCQVSESALRESDATHLTMCEVACAAVRSAGYGSGQKPLPATGIYIGNCTGSNLEAELIYNSHAAELGQMLQDAGRGTLPGALLDAAARGLVDDIRARTTSWQSSPVRNVTPISAARLIQQALCVSGPALALDAACASSFYAIQLAAMALHRGRIGAAVAGAFSYRNWWEMVLLSPTQTISATHSSPFSADSDGMVPSDGYVAVVLKTLHQAQQDGDPILGVIRGMGISSDGRGKAIWAPRQEGQVAAIRRAWSTGLDPRRLQYIEAHATSTQLGDATEVASLTESLGHLVAPGTPVGSVKANVGHTLEVAGMAGLIKTILAMQHGMIPAALPERSLNPAFDGENIPFQVTRKAIPWEAPANGLPRRAGIDAFGIGGLNLHLVLDQQACRNPTADTDSSVPFTPLPQNPFAAEPLAVVGTGQPLNRTQLVREFLELATVPHSPSLPYATAGQDSADNYTFDWKKHRIPPRQIDTANPLQFLLLDASVAALEAGGLIQRGFDRMRATTVVGTHFTSDFACDALLGARLPEIREVVTQHLMQHGATATQAADVMAILKTQLLQQKPASLDVTGSLSSSTLSSMISKHLDLMGGAVTVEAGAMTAHAALLTAADLLQSNTSDLVICAVGQRLTDISFQDMQRAGKGPSPNCLGTGAAAIVLKRLSDARRDGDPILAILPAEITQSLTQRLQQSCDSKADRVAPETRLIDSPAPATPAAVTIPRNHRRDTPDREQLIADLIDAILEMTGLPATLVHQDADLTGDLGLTQATRSILLTTLLSRLPGTTVLPASCTTAATLAQIIDHALAQPNTSAVTPEDTNMSANATQPASASTARSNARPLATPESMRCVWRAVEQPLPPSAVTAPVFTGAALILGDNPAAVALHERLQSLHITTHRLAFTADTSLLMTQAEQILSQQPVPHLFLMTPRDPLTGRGTASASLWNQEVGERLISASLICQRWYRHVAEAGLLPQASVVAATATGGDFGVSGRFETLAGGGLSALLKSLREESRNRLQVRIIDAPDNEPAKMLATAILRELASASDDLETASVRGKRLVLRATCQPASRSSEFAPAEGSVWIVHGVLRRNVADAAIRMASQRGLQLHLIGPDPHPQLDDSLLAYSADQHRELQQRIMRQALAEGKSPIEEWKSLQRALELSAVLKACQNAGTAATWHPCDVGNREALRRVLADIRHQDGPVTGIIHARSAPPPRQFAKLSQSSLQQALQDGVAAAVSLMELTADDPVTHFVCLCSPAGRLGAGLRSAESMADELMALAVNRSARKKAPGCSGISLAVPWMNGVAESPSASLPEPLTKPPASGSVASDAFLMGTGSGGHETEILLWPRSEGSQPSLPTLPMLPTEQDCQRSAHRDHCIRVSPLIEHAFPGAAGQGIADIHFDPVQDPFLNGHLVEGIPLLPAVAGIESCAQAAFVWSEGRSVQRLRSLQISNGFRMARPEIHLARVVMSGTRSELNCELVGDFYDKQGLLTDPYRQYQTCLLDLSDQLTPVPVPDLGQPPATWTEVPYPNDWREMGAADSGTVYYGPELRTLKQVHHEPQGSWGRMLAPAAGELGGRRPGSRWHTPAALLDGALFLCDLYAAHHLGTRQLPHVIDQIDFGRLPRSGEECLARVIYRGQSGRRLTWDFWILGSDNTVILWTQGFHVVTL